MTQSVLFDLLECDNGSYIGVATLNKPQALNALDLEMVNLLFLQLSSWQQRDDVAMVLIDSRGDKAFCAGGDVVSMHQAMAKMHTQKGDMEHFEQADIPAPIETFFSQEYRLDYLIHCFGKPILVWGNGIIMGGGIGLMSGASHRVVTASSRLAMPEVSIGLYPDVGASWFLNRMPHGCGLFLGITATNIDASDALYVSLADYFIEHDKKTELIGQLKSVMWQQDAQNNHQLLSDLCQQFDHSQQAAPGPIQSHQELISQLAQHTAPGNYVDALLKLDATDNKWLSKAQQSVEYGSSITICLVFEQLVRGQDKSLAECFQMELAMSCRCATIGEFQEGVRALLVDKDRKPQWLFSDVNAIPGKVIDSFFTSPWTTHPLEDIAKLNIAGVKK